MTGDQIRRHLRAELVRGRAPAAEFLLIDELGVRHGKGRADLALVDGYLNGFEIKGDRDSIGRLQRQAALYSAVFDTVTLVLTHKHVDRALTLVPEWWGLTLASPDSKSVIRFDTCRVGSVNKHVDHVAQARLLWRDEVLAVLFGMGEPRSVARRPRRDLYKILTAALEPALLRSTIRTYLGARKGWRSA